MVYSVGDVIVCNNPVNAQCLEMSNPDFEISVGDEYIITDLEDYSDDKQCICYELTSTKDSAIILTAWNEDMHMVIDEHFSIV